LLQPLTVSALTVKLLILALALTVDILLGEPPKKIHPTVWMGKFIAFIEQKLKVNSVPKTEKLNGVYLAVMSVAFFGFLCHLILYVCHYIHVFLFLIVGVFLLKSTFALKSMREHVIPITEALNGGDLPRARSLVSRIVSRDTSNFDGKHVISATVESVAESTVDGVTSPLFYFSISGIMGAFVYRVINTLDSMVGYKNHYTHFGWFSAKMDTLANFIPARITAYLMILASILTGGNGKYIHKILKRDSSKTESLNAGWPIAAMAGALEVQLEKPGVYRLGENKKELSVESIYQALQIMQITVFLFTILIVIPILVLVHLA
jgi:adenosylcobinamide-phosphate synthase